MWPCRHNLADVPLLCLRPGNEEEKGGQSVNQQLSKQALSLLACLLELQHFSLLQHLLLGQDRSGGDTCLGLRLCLYATSLLNACDGKSITTASIIMWKDLGGLCAIHDIYLVLKKVNRTSTQTPV